MKQDNTPPSDCIFCAIATGVTPADIVHQDDEVAFFHDINPKAAVHILGIPKQHIPSVSNLAAEHEAIMGKLMHQVANVARDQGLTDSGYRLIINAGSNAGQEVPHLHVHIMGGEPLGPMRC